MGDANTEDPNGKKINEETQLHLNTYKVIESPPESLDDRPKTTGLFFYSDMKSEAEAQKPAGETPTPKPLSPESLTERIQRFAENPKRFYATIGLGVGVLIGVIFAAVSLFTGRPPFMGNPEGRYDLGPVISSGTGLNGHLYINWEKKLHYRLTFHADDPELQADFAFAVANSPQPLSIVIELQDAQGSVLCNREIVLKYDARSAVTNLPYKPAATVDLAQLQADEQVREEGRDVFQNQIAPDGQVASIIAQGELPCSAKDYEKTTQWNFSTNFPSIDEQDEWLERRPDLRANAAQRSAAHRRAARAAVKLLPFSIEGDDNIVEFDVDSGVIVTSGRNTFFFDKTSKVSADPVWQEYPVNIHFRCDRSSDCTLMHAGAGALHARMKR
jgi:hypothetical protein